jgi:transcriptional regulator with XRE-family HTH domain
MIANEKQYQITKKKLLEFKNQLLELEQSESGKNDLLNQIYINSLNAKIEDFSSELHEYELLKRGELNNVALADFSDISQVLIKARIARGLTQANLAELVNLKEQQIQRYEANYYSTISWPRLNQILKVLRVTFSPIIAQINTPFFDIGNKVSQEEVAKAQERLVQKRNILIH